MTYPALPKYLNPPSHTHTHTHTVGPPPSGIDFYIHRSGRTGRKGQIGQSILVLVDGDNSSKFTIDPDDFLRQVNCFGDIYVI